MGLNRETAYLFIRGHDLFDKVTIPLLKEMGETITNKRFELLKIANNTEGVKHYDDFLKQHSYRTYLKQYNKAYQTHFLFTKIINKMRVDFESPS